MATDALTSMRSEAEDGVHEMAIRRGGGKASELVRRYAGYDERESARTRREVANTGVHLILAFGDPLGIAYAEAEEPAPFGTFVVGTHTRAALTTYVGHQKGVQVDLSISAAHAVLGVPPVELTDRVVPLDAILGRRGRHLVERLAGLGGWADRFGLLDELIGARRDEATGLDGEVRWLERQLAMTHGSARVEALMDETGWSRRHLTARFRHQVGVPPKTYARLLRFERAVGLLGSRAGRTPLGGIAADAGYYDQAHFDREFREFAGSTPTQFLREAAAEPEVSFVQDLDGPDLYGFSP